MSVARNLIAWTFIISTCSCVAALVVPIGGCLRLFGKEPAERWGDFTVNWWIRSLRFLYGVQVDVTGLQNIAPDQNYVIVSPHRSHLDAIVIIVALFPKLRFGFMVKRTLTRIPMWGWFIQLSGYLPVDRNKRGATTRIDPLQAGVDRPARGPFGSGLPRGHTRQDPSLLTGEKRRLYALGTLASSHLADRRLGNWNAHAANALDGRAWTGAGRSACATHDRFRTTRTGQSRGR